MFTVLIAEKEHIDAIRQENSLFFEPFLENKELAFCYWNPKGQNFQDSVPGLQDAVGRQKNWRAVIVNNCTIADSKKRNPFDTVDYSGVSSLKMPNRQPALEDSLVAWEEEWNAYYEALAKEKEIVYQKALEKPLQKLATWLCFRPEEYVMNDVREKQDAYDWAREQLTKDEKKPSVKLEMMEREHYKLEMRLKENIRRKLVREQYLNVAYPSEVYCISPRAAENNYFDPEAYWTVRQDNEYSSFADRNMYFDRMRFIVFDMLAYTHRDFRNDYIRFMAFLLILATNSVPSSTMQARRLYRVEMETDETPLRTLVTSYDRKLAASYDVIEAEIEQISYSIPGVLTDKTAEQMFCSNKEIAVILDESCDTESIYAEKDFGLFFDSPEDEYRKWDRSIKRSEKALSYIARQQGRAVRKSVSQMHFSSEVNDVNISRLTPLQIEDIRDYTNGAENDMVNSMPPDLTDLSKYDRQLNEASEKVKKVISQRMSKKTTLALAGFCLALFFICFCPFLLDNGGSVRTTITAVSLIGGMLGALAVVMVVTLFVLRWFVTNAVGDYNNKIHEIISDIQGSLKKFSTYLGAACNVRRGHAIQNYSKENVDVYTIGLRIRKKHQEDIRRKRAYLAEDYSDYFGDRSCCDEVMSRPYPYDFGVKVEYTYPAPFLAGDCRQIEFMSAGNIVTVPSSYVTKVSVRMEGIYE